MTGRRYVVELAIPPDEFLRLYEGTASSVVARDRLTGKTVRFPAARLRAFVSDGGVHGCFELFVDADNRLQKIARLEQHNA